AGKLERTTPALVEGAPTPAKPPVRQLKRPEEVELAEIELVGAGAKQVAGKASSKRIDLRAPGTRGGGPDAGTQTAPRTRAPRADKNYDEQDVQAVGLEVLHRHLREQFSVDLVDQHRLQRVGADATDELGEIYVELKAFAAELPDTVTLT